MTSERYAYTLVVCQIVYSLVMVCLGVVIQNMVVSHEFLKLIRWRHVASSGHDVEPSYEVVRTREAVPSEQPSLKSG